MKLISKDILFTLALKIVLLFALWLVCVHGMRPVLISANDWMFGTQKRGIIYDSSQ